MKTMNRFTARWMTTAAFAITAACHPPTPQPPAQDPHSPATAEEAAAFVARFNEEGAKLGLEVGKAAWVQSTYITEDTQWLSGKTNERWLNFKNEAIEEAKRFDGLDLPPDVARALMLIKQNISMPAPRAPEKVAQLAQLSTKLQAMYGQGKHCRQTATGQKTAEPCRDLGALRKIMAESRDDNELLDAWTGWRSISPPMRDDYTQFATLMNEGARELGFQDTGDLWKAGYDMNSADFEKEADRLWQQVKPLYDELHCYVRDQLAKHYGSDKVPAGKPIPAHLLGNMWAQEWGNIYPLVKPFESESKLNITAALKEQGYTALKMVKSAESFYTSTGMKPLPEGFWKRSMFVKPRDRDVVCHASAWDVDPPNDDLRIKMCIHTNEEDLITIYHELGHIYYYIYYKNQPLVFQSGAHDGFHEAIGDALTLSMTPGYYQSIGLIKAYQKDPKALINGQMKLALDKIAFLPFGKLIDQWRWDVFAGKIKPSEYNAAWWKLRTDYQGIAAPVARSEANFDPGAKYHIPGNTPYTRYFLARILQFQIHRAMCQAAGHTGPLHECSIYRNKAAGTKLAAMLSLGQSQPWPHALEQLTGTRQMDASAIVEYFQPLMTWLRENNKERRCGWE